jgi:hypothetical protein
LPDVAGLLELEVVTFFYAAEIRHFAIKKKSIATWARELFENFLKKSSHFKEKKL